MREIIVIGPPRSGSSVVARLLQESLDVMMDEGPVRKDTHNPKGYYEDYRIVGINERMTRRWEMGKTKTDKMDPIWAVEFAKWVAYRTRNFNGRQWGFKDPRCVGFIGWVRQFFPNAIWIVTDRKDEQIIKSQVEKIGVPSAEIAKAGLVAYRNMIKENLNDYHTIDLSQHRSESSLTSELAGIING